MFLTVYKCVNYVKIYQINNLLMQSITYGSYLNDSSIFYHNINKKLLRNPEDFRLLN